MKSSIVAGLLAGITTLALPVAGFAQSAGVAVVEGRSDTGARLEGGALEVRAKVVEIDQKSRIATLQGPKGNIVIVDVPADVKNLEQVRAGDDLVFRYAAAVLAKLEKVRGAGGIRETVETTEKASAPAGAMPGTAGRRTVDILAKVSAVNTKARTVTLRGATRTVTLPVPQDTDIKAFKVGDDVRATIIEAAVLNVERPAGK